jgi:hypothetical protein
MKPLSKSIFKNVLEIERLEDEKNRLLKELRKLDELLNSDEESVKELDGLPMECTNGLMIENTLNHLDYLIRESKCYCDS